MHAHYAVGQKVAVNIGGCVENRTEGVIAAIRHGTDLEMYEIDFPSYRRDRRIEKLYVPEELIPLD